MLEDSTRRSFSRQRTEIHLYFPCADGTVNLAGKDHEVRTSLPTRNPLHRRERIIPMVLKERRTDLIQQKNNQRITMKPEMIFGVFLGVTFIMERCVPLINELWIDETCMCTAECDDVLSGLWLEMRGCASRMNAHRMCRVTTDNR